MVQMNQQLVHCKHHHTLLLLFTQEAGQQHVQNVRRAYKVMLLLLWITSLVLARPMQQISSEAAVEAVQVTMESPQPVVLQAMMNASVNHLVFHIPFFQLVPEAWTYITEQTPFMLMHNFTITSDVEPQTVIDYQYLAHRVALGNGKNLVSFTFKNVTLAKVRKANNVGIDWFTKSPGAIVVLENVVLVDSVCSASPADALAAAAAAPALPGYPPNSASIAPSACVHLPDGQRCFENSLHYGSFAETNTAGDGNIIVQRNTTRVCLAYVDPECLKQHDLDFCWEQKAQEVQPTPHQTSPAQLSAGAAAGIAVAGVVGLIAALTCCWWFCRRTRKAQQQQRQQQDGSKDNPSHRSQIYTLDSITSLTRSAYSSGVPDTVVPASRPSMSTGNVELGILLGAGSFGRVYKGKWRNSDVAIKVINCSAKELPKVLQEAEVMLKLDHEFIVRALHCLVVDKTHRTESGHTNHGSEGIHSSRQPRSSVGNSVLSLDLATGPGSLAAHASTSHSHSSSHSQQQHLQSPASRKSTSASPSGPILPKTSSAGRRILTAMKLLGSSSKGSACAHSTDSARQRDVHGSSSSTIGTGGLGSTVQGYCTVGESQKTPEPVQMMNLGTNELAVLTSMPPDLTTGTATGQPSAREDVEVWLVMELCSGGTLKASCSKPKDTMTMGKLVARLLEVAQGMAYLHSHNCIHGDLKAANVMLKSTIYGSFGQVSKISDFGLAFTLMDGATHRSTQTTGTISHSAPEVLTTGRLSPAADVYAFGIMMWELFTARSAFQHAHYGNVVQRVVAGERPTMPVEAPEEYQLLMSHCWAADPKARPSFEQVAECLTLLLDNLQGLTTELLGSPEVAVQADKQELDTAAAAVAGVNEQTAAVSTACNTPSLRRPTQAAAGTASSLPNTAALQQQLQQSREQQPGSAGSTLESRSGSRRSQGLVIESRHVQDL